MAVLDISGLRLGRLNECVTFGRLGRLNECVTFGRLGRLNDESMSV